MYVESGYRTTFKNKGSECWIEPSRKNYFILYGLMTDKDKVNQGYGSKLLEEVKQYCKEKNKRIKLFVDCFYHKTKKNGDLIKWYAKNGFKVETMTKPNIWMSFD